MKLRLPLGGMMWCSLGNDMTENNDTTAREMLTQKRTIPPRPFFLQEKMQNFFTNAT